MTRARIEQASVLWVLLWGAVALDSAMTYRRSLEAVEQAIEADPVLELYEGPPAQKGSVQRWLLGQSPTLQRLRAVSRRAKLWATRATFIALAGPPIFYALTRRNPGRA